MVWGSAALAPLWRTANRHRTGLAWAAVSAVAFTAAVLLKDAVLDGVRRFLGVDGKAQRLRPLRSGRKLKVAIIGGGVGGTATALWLRDALGDCGDLDIAVFGDGLVGGRCRTVDFEGEQYEAGAAIVSELNIYFQALMRRFGLHKRLLEGLHMPFGIFDGSRILFCGTSATAAGGWGALAKLRTSAQLILRFGLRPLMRLKGLAKSSTAPNFARLYRALRDGATFAHPRELLSTLGHGCLRMSERSTEQWMLGELGMPQPLVRELAEPGMRCNYGGQGCNDLHAFVGLVSICGGLGSKCFSVCNGNNQVPQRALDAARARLLRGTVRVVRKTAAEAPCEPGFEVAYDASARGEAMEASSSSLSRSRSGDAEVDGLLVEAFHVVVVAHPLEHSALHFEGCSGAATGAVAAEVAGGAAAAGNAAGALNAANGCGEFRRCVAHFVRGSLRLERFPAGGAQEEEPAPLMVPPAHVWTTADSSAPFYSIGLQFPVRLGTVSEMRQVLASAERGEPQVYKVFAPRQLSEEELDRWFTRRRGSRAFVVDWRAYPQYSVPQPFRPFVLDAEGIYYVNAIEQVASAMEMSLIGARNVVNLVGDWVAQRRGPRGF